MHYEINEIRDTPQSFSVSKASEGLREEMISDKKLPKLVDEVDPHFKT
jgi:hypothetical protein